MNDKQIKFLAWVPGIAGTFAPSDSLRGLAWGIDGTALIIACSLLTLWFLRMGHEFVAAGFLVFALGESLVVSVSAMELVESTPSFGAGVGLWAAGLVLISTPSTFPIIVRLLGFATAILFAWTACLIFTGAQITPLSEPLPSYGYPVLVATLVGWIAVLLRGNIALRRP